jgi:arylsulfatase A-like enzyme
VLFTNAWSPWPETSGSHMSLFTSRYPSEHGVTGFVHAPPLGLPVLAERLRRAGYVTRAFTEDGGVWAFAGFARGFSAYTERRSFDFVYRGEAAATFKDATRWLEANAARQFFLFVHTYQVHAPYVPPKEYRDLFVDIPGREAPGLVHQALSYDRETRYTDDQVGPFLATIERLGIADRTIVVITSDHGEEFGEHGGSGHGRTVFPEVLRVPLIVAAPGVLAPARSAAPVSILDVAPTLLDLLELEPDTGARGVSLVEAAAGAPLAGRTLVGEVDRMDPRRINQVAARRDGRAAILDVEAGTVRCYGADDPGEQRPTTGCPDLEAAIAEHRRTSVRIDAAPSAQPTGAVDPRLIEKMRALGYVE